MKPNFQKFLTRKHALLTDDILTAAWIDAKRFKKVAGVNECVKDIEIIDGDFCFDMNWMEAITKKYKNKEIKFFKDFIKKGISSGEKLKKFSRGLKINEDQKKLKTDFCKSIELLKDLLVFLPETHPLAKIIEDKIISILKKKKILDSEIEETLLEVAQPKKLNGPKEEQLDLLKIKTNFGKKGFDVREALRKHWLKYSYLGYREPFSNGYSEAFFKARLKTVKAENSKESKIKFSREERKYINLMQALVFFRNYRTEKLYEALFYLENLWKKIARNYGLKETDLGYYFLEEINSLFEAGKKVSREEIKERKRGRAVLIYDGKRKFIFSHELESKKEAVEPKKIEVEEVKGMVACRGIVLGTAKVILRASEQNKIKKGDILITSMTTPDFLPCMRRAAAFVTDEGGITCHAAIVAREMDKPCIIGTKIATRILKSGDLIEVDGDKGLIKILK